MLWFQVDCYIISHIIQCIDCGQLCWCTNWWSSSTTWRCISMVTQYNTNTIDCIIISIVTYITNCSWHRRRTWFNCCYFNLSISLLWGLPTIYHIFAESVPVEQRSRAFSYLSAAGSIGQTIAAVVGLVVMFISIDLDITTFILGSSILFIRFIGIILVFIMVTIWWLY